MVQVDAVGLDVLSARCQLLAAKSAVSVRRVPRPHFQRKQRQLLSKPSMGV